MKSYSHTPGPWLMLEVSPDNVDRLLVSRGPLLDTHIAIISRPAVAPDYGADLALIAAAPDLLAALQMALKDLSALSQWDTASACAIKARAAIAKAEGIKP